jgi:hypothetical protein
MKASAAKPGVGGGIWTAPEGTTLPTDASTALNSAFTSLGYVSEDGVKRNISRDSNVVHAWGGDPVAVLSTKKTETFKFKLIEPNNVSVLGLTFGEATGTLADGITVKSKADISTPRAYVISTLLADNVHQRIVIPAGVVTDIGEISYVDNDVIGFELTITAIADTNGNTAYEYQKTIAAAS